MLELTEHGRLSTLQAQSQAQRLLERESANQDEEAADPTEEQKGRNEAAIKRALRLLVKGRYVLRIAPHTSVPKPASAAPGGAASTFSGSAASGGRGERKSGVQRGRGKRAAPSPAAGGLDEELPLEVRLMQQAQQAAGGGTAAGADAAVAAAAVAAPAAKKAKTESGAGKAESASEASNETGAGSDEVWLEPEALWAVNADQFHRDLRHTHCTDLVKVSL